MALFRPGKPWRSRGLSANVSAGASGSLVPFNVAVGDGSCTDISGGLQIGLAGLYLVTYGLGRASGTGGGGVLQVTVRLNGTAWILGHANNGTGSAGVSGARIAELVATDQLTVISSNGGTLRATDTYLQVVRVGPVRWTG